MNAAAGTAPALSIVGEFTIFTAQDCKAQLLALIASIPEGGSGEVDLSGVTEIDSAGLQLMLMAKREAAILGKEMRFVRHSDPVLELIDLCALAGQFGDPLLIRSPV
ncbi:lipid asymmetry maintenance protein MlaB [Azonexus sp.]|uniref:STAS domain-containing protein n=1 Tax=Azonexus sp. TaxID=1872668 RepID=UPI0035B070C5